MCFTCINLIFIVPILLMRKLNPEVLNNLLIITQLVIGRAGIRIQICLIPEHIFLFYTTILYLFFFRKHTQINSFRIRSENVRGVLDYKLHLTLGIGQQRLWDIALCQVSLQIQSIGIILNNFWENLASLFMKREIKVSLGSAFVFKSKAIPRK